MSRFLVCFLLCLTVPVFTQAAPAKHTYVEANLVDLTKLSAHYNVFDLHDSTTFTDYLKVTECDIYQSVTNNPFKQNKMQQAVLQSLTTAQQKDQELYFRLPISLMVSGYNFDTQSLPIMPDSQFKKVNVLELIPPRILLCGKDNTGSLTKIPSVYVAKLDFPISLYRIPLQRDVAESISKRLSFYQSSTTVQIIYGYMLIKIEAIQPQAGPDHSDIKATVRAQMDAIDLYTDQDRKIFFKRLDFSENY